MTTPEPAGAPATVPMWVLEEYITQPDGDGGETRRWIYRRTFYDEDALTWHLDHEAAYFYNPDPHLRVSRIDLPIADSREVFPTTSTPEPEPPAEPPEPSETETTEPQEGT